MRPVEKGDWPQVLGQNVLFDEYSEARPFLIDERIGDYCSYCENQITNPAVEHISPKQISPGIELNWYNFILGCVNCNSTKGHSWLNMDDYYWPDMHNTFLIFEYLPGGVVRVKSTLHHSVNLTRATNTLNLTGLYRYGSNASSADRRWVKRSQAWGKATHCLNYFENKGNPSDYIPSITNTATSTGYWSVWIEVFKHHYEVQEALTEAFEGTFSDYLFADINRL